MNDSNICNSYIIINDMLNIQEPHESWIELCNYSKQKLKLQNKKFTKIYNLSNYFIPDSPKYYFKTKTINIIEIKLLFNKLNIKFSEKTNLNNIVSSLQCLYPDYARFNAIDINYNTPKDDKQLFSLLFCYIIINSNNSYGYLQSDSYLMALCRHMTMYTKNKDNTNDNDINIVTYILFKTLLTKKHYNKFFFADEELWIGQFFFKWSIFNILLKERPDLFKYYWKYQHKPLDNSSSYEELMEFKYIIENTIFGLLSISPPFINNFQNIDNTVKIYKDLLKNDIHTIFSYYAAYCIKNIPENFQITKTQNLQQNIHLFSCHTTTSWYKYNIFNNPLPDSYTMNITNDYFSKINFNKMKNEFYLYTKIINDTKGDTNILLLPYYNIDPRINNNMLFFNPIWFFNQHL
jgi:hypothetical protein